ncbi:hypothetical protein KEJ27_00580 [Candidatus Bathyarchaeota archaeon]|nr:hypothetical protein [Candidatus Bathyarchaeota archaeon]
MTGGILAFAIMILWHAKDYLREVFGAAIKVTPKVKELEAGEPVSYRTAFIMLAIGCLLLIASNQMDFTLGIIFFIFAGFIYPLVEAYAQGFTGMVYAQERGR